MDVLPDPESDAMLEARLICASLFSIGGHSDACDYLFGLLDESDFMVFGKLFAHLSKTWMARRFATGYQRALALRRYIADLDSGDKDAAWRAFAFASRWPCEFIYREDAARLRQLAIRRREWFVVMNIRAKALNPRRAPTAVVVESRTRLDELTDFVNRSEPLLACLERVHRPYT